MTKEIDDKEAKKEALKARSEAMAAKETKLNEGRTGKGTRFMVAMTRGKTPQEVVYEAFDETKPETLPTDVEDFMTVTGVTDDKTLLSFLIDGFNSAAYSTASDPIAEFVEPTWSDELKARFRLVIRNYAAGSDVSIEDAVSLIKPGFIAVAAKAAAEALAAAK